MIWPAGSSSCWTRKTRRQNRAMSYCTSPVRNRSLIWIGIGISEHFIDDRPNVVVIEPATLKHPDQPPTGNDRIEPSETWSLLQRKLSCQGEGIGRLVHI